MNAQNTDQLNKKQESIVAIAGLTAKGDSSALKDAINKGLDAGLTINEIKEVEVQMYAYCGFPRSLNGINALMSVTEERKTKGIKDIEGKDASPIAETDKYQTGKKTLQQLTGREEKVPTGANAFAPAIDTFLKEHLFADIFSRDVLNYAERELATISSLMSMSGVESQLKAHLAMGMNVGISEAQLQAAISVIEKSIGSKEAGIAKEVLSQVLSEKGKSNNQ